MIDVNEILGSLIVAPKLLVALAVDSEPSFRCGSEEETDTYTNALVEQGSTLFKSKDGRYFELKTDSDVVAIDGVGEFFEVIKLGKTQPLWITRAHDDVDIGEAWNERFEPSNYDDISDFKNYTISWAIDEKNLNLGKKLLNDFDNLKAAVFINDDIYLVEDFSGHHEDLSMKRLEITRSCITAEPQIYLSFKDRVGYTHYFNISNLDA